MNNISPLIDHQMFRLLTESVYSADHLVM